MLAESVKRRHIDLIDIGTLLPVDLDIDEQAVHDRCDFGILETFMGHDMAPVARRVADRQEDGLTVASGLGKGVRSPGSPVDWIVLVLEEVGACFFAEEVFAHEFGDTLPICEWGVG